MDGISAAGYRRPDTRNGIMINQGKLSVFLAWLINQGWLRWPLRDQPAVPIVASARLGPGGLAPRFDSRMHEKV